MPSLSASERVLYLVTCAAPPARRIHHLIDLLQQDGWDIHLIATSTAFTWLPTAELATQTTHPVVTLQRHPDEPKLLPRARAVAVVPASFNTINKWAVGINDSLALGILNESLGAGLPIVAAPYAKAALTSHPAYAENLARLTNAGVRVIDPDELNPVGGDDGFRWDSVRTRLSDL